MSDRVRELLGEPIRNIFGYGFYFDIEYYGYLLDIPCMVSQSVCVWYTSDPSVRPDALSIDFVFVCVCQKLLLI